MRYKGYIGEASYDSKIKMYEGRIVNASIGTFAAEKPEDLEKEFRKTVDIYFEVCNDKKIKPLKPL